MRWSLIFFFFLIYSQRICKIHHAFLGHCYKGGEKGWIIACNGDAFHRVILLFVQAPLAFQKPSSHADDFVWSCSWSFVRWAQKALLVDKRCHQKLKQLQLYVFWKHLWIKEWNPTINISQVGVFLMSLEKEIFLHWNGHFFKKNWNQFTRYFRRVTQWWVENAAVQACLFACWTEGIAL